MLCRARNDVQGFCAARNHSTANAQRRVSANCRQSEHCHAYTAASHNSKQQPTRERANTIVSSNPSGIHRPSNARRRTRYEQHGWPQLRQTPQHRTTQNINEKQRGRIQLYAATPVHSGVCTQLAWREHALPCQSQSYPATQAEHLTAYPLSAERAGAVAPDTAAPYHQNTQKEQREGIPPYATTQVHSASTQLGEEEQAQPCQPTQHRTPQTSSRERADTAMFGNTTKVRNVV